MLIWLMCGSLMTIDRGMDLLPKSSTEFSSKNYWNEFFSKRGNKSFEWYGDYTELCGYLHKYMRPTDKILVPGCGNSTLSADLYKVGMRDVTSVDLSEIVISQMKGKYPELRWIHGDIFNLDLDDGAFSCILDKGTLDALMSDECTDKATSNSVKYFTEMCRITKTGGRFICITLLQEHILNAILNWFPVNCWIIRFIRCVEAEKKQSEKGSLCLPVFIVICTKFKKMDSFTPLIELDIQEGPMRRVTNVSEVKETISAAQQYAMLKHNLQNKIVYGDEIKFELCCPKSGQVRYRLYIVDSPKSSNHLQYAVFIVPHGRENEWLFNDYKGQIQLAASAGANRLVIVHLMRDQTYGSIKDVQDELSSKITDLAPSNMTKQGKIPFLSVGQDLGERKEIYRGKSLFSGEFMIEDIKQESDNCIMRRLIFLNSQNIIQSEARLNIEKKKKGSKKNLTYVVDHSYLTCSHHSIMIGAMELVSHSASVLLIGLGGGALAIFLHNYFPQANITAVDIDETMLEVATKWFNFHCSERLKCNIDDGLHFIKKSALDGTKYDIIMFDIDSKDYHQGLSCPPRPFLERDFLENVATCLTSKGMFVLNLVCRDGTLKEALLQDLTSIFPIIVKISVPDEVNDVLFCQYNSTRHFEKKYLNDKFTELNEYFRLKTSITEEVLNVNEIVTNFVVISSN